MRRTRHKVTFAYGPDKWALLWGQIGLGNRGIMRETGLRDSQITFRLHKAKKGLKRKKGFRVAWRDGDHPLMARFMAEFSSVMIEEIDRKLTPLYAHPEPKVKVVE